MDRWMHFSAFQQGEVQLQQVQCSRIYDGDSKTNYKDAMLKLTSNRMIYGAVGRPPIALPLDLVGKLSVEAASFFSSSKLVLSLSKKPAAQAEGPVATSSANSVKFSLKESDVAWFMEAVQKATSDRAWDPSGIKNLSIKSKTGDRPAGAGILGIERAMQAKHEETSNSISVAFQDMKQLLKQANQMVQLAHNIAQRMKDQGGDVSQDETSHFRSCLLSLGIDDPITRDAVGSTSEYHQKLATEVCTALEPAVREAGGVMLLSEVYCRINRARGMQLLSPEDLSNASSLMERKKLPLILQTFPSGVQVLQLSSLNTQALVEETRQMLEEYCGSSDAGWWRGMSAGELGRTARLPLMLAKERLALCECNGGAVRDESNEGIMFYPNYFDLMSDGE